MNIDAILKQASTRGLEPSDVEALLAKCPEPPTEALDRLAVDLATKFILGRAHFRDAHAVATLMFQFAQARGVPGGMLNDVYGAFDAGQTFSGADSPLENPVSSHTRPQLAKLLARLVAT